MIKCTMNDHYVERISSLLWHIATFDLGIKAREGWTTDIHRELRVCLKVLEDTVRVYNSYLAWMEEHHR